MSINNRQRVVVLGCVGALAGVLGTAGLSFDGSFDARALPYTVPFAMAAVAGTLRAPRMSAAILFGFACGGFGVEAWTASINRQGCIAFLDIGSALDIAPASCSPIGLVFLLIASIASGVAASLVGRARIGRGVVYVLAGIVLAPVLLYLLSIATFGIRAS
jgi:hypothetical protein